MKKKTQKYDSVKALKDAGKKVTNKQELVLKKLDHLIEKVDRIADQFDPPKPTANVPPQPKPAPRNILLNDFTQKVTYFDSNGNPRYEQG